MTSTSTTSAARANRVLWCLVALTLPFTTPAHAQFPLQSAEGKSGLLSDHEAGLLNYEASKSRVGFKMVASLPTTNINDPLTAFIFDAGFSANKSQRDLFKGGSFTPGYDLGFTVSHTIENTDVPGYRQYFVRAILDSAAQKTVTPDGSTLKLSSDAGTTAGVAVGYNHAVTENVIWGTSVIGQHFWNSTDGLDTKKVCVQEQSGTDTDGRTVTVSTCDDRFVGPLRNKWGAQLRSDFSWNAAELSGKKSATIGVLASASADFAQATNTSFNISVGPAIYRPNYPTQVVFTALIEVVDIGNRLGHSPKLSDQLRFRVYVGIPFESLKSQD